MTINPIAFADEVNKQFLRYQLTAFPLSDPDMADQAKQMLEGADPDSHLIKGPYISLSRSFAEGDFIEVLEGSQRKDHNDHDHIHSGDRSVEIKQSSLTEY